VNSASAAISMRGVVALLGAFPALSGCDLQVERGEVVVLRGPNGAGKTTVLKVAGGLVPIVRGQLTVLGSDVRVDRRSIRRYVGYLGHATGLYSDLTVEQNVGFVVRATGADQRNIPSALGSLGLDGRLRHLSIAHLSAGQRRRVALAGLVARNVPLWLLDEPHAALDPDGRDLIDSLIHAAAGGGTSVVLASHDLERATNVADRTVQLVGGRVVSAKRAKQAEQAEQAEQASQLSAVEADVSQVKAGSDVA
jgi:heme ABC exporter ATP-binding subunit CcmA